MIVRIALKIPHNTILNKTYFGVTALVILPRMCSNSLIEKRGSSESIQVRRTSGGPRLQRPNCPCRERGSCSNRITGT